MLSPGVRYGEATAVRSSSAANGTPIHDGDVGCRAAPLMLSSLMLCRSLDLIAKMQEKGDNLTILAQVKTSLTSSSIFSPKARLRTPIQTLVRRSA